MKGRVLLVLHDRCLCKTRSRSISLFLLDDDVNLIVPLAFPNEVVTDEDVAKKAHETQATAPKLMEATYTVHFDRTRDTLGGQNVCHARTSENS